MAHSDHFLKLYDKDGNLLTVMLSAELWQRGQQRIESLVETLLENIEPTEVSEPLEDWIEFQQYWDFKYPFEASVTCKGCGKTTEDWTTDPQKPFILKSAQLGGLVVFTCTSCQAIVRKKHFKDHVCFEFTPKTAA